MSKEPEVNCIVMFPLGVGVYGVCSCSSAPPARLSYVPPSPQLAWRCCNLKVNRTIKSQLVFMADHKDYVFRDNSRPLKFS